MMVRLGKILALFVAVLAMAFFIFRVPDTDPAEMREKYGAAPSQFVKVSSGEIVHLRDEGPRDAVPIILLHGSNADISTWQEWTEALRGDYRIIRFDQSGHGLTGPDPKDDYSLENYIADINAVAEAVGVDKFVLGGNSMGGAIAMGYAIENPERLLGLILIDAGGAPIKREGGGNLAFTLAAMPGVGDVMSQLLPRSLVERSLSQSVSNQAIVTPEAVDRYWEMARYPGNRNATRIRFSAPRKAFAEQDIAAVQTPTLVMWGEQDTLIPYDAAGWYMEHLPNATLANYPEIGHLPQEEAATTSAADLREWLENLQSGNPVQ